VIVVGDGGHIPSRMSSLQSFVANATKVEALSANISDNSSGALPALWLFITSLFAAAFDHLVGLKERISEWIQKPGTFVP
jgi:hypothetical protein